MSSTTHVNHGRIRRVVSARHPRPWPLALALVLAGLTAHAAVAAEAKQATELFPHSTAIYAQLESPSALVSTILEHPAYQKIQRSDIYQKVISTPDFVEFTTILGLVETRLGASWQEAIGILAAGGLELAIDTETEGLAILAKSKSPERRMELIKELVELAREDARNKGKEDPFHSGEYRGIKALRGDGIILAELGDWLLVCNKKELAQKLADTYLDGSATTLATNERFQRARAHETSSPAWVYVDIHQLRAAGLAKDLFRNKAKDFGEELILGGVLANLAHTDFLTVSFSLDNQQLAMRLQTPHDPAWVSEARDYYWGPAGQGAAPDPLPKLPEQLFSLGIYRDLSELWMRSADLFDQKVVDELANADSGLTNLFGGRDFGEEILGAVHPHLQFIATRQAFAEGATVPAVKLPAFALVAELKDAETMRPELRRTFQSVVGFLNVIGANQGQPQLDMRTERAGERDMVLTQYLPQADADSTDGAPINYNFSPSVGFVGSHFVLASTAGLAQQLTAALDDSGKSNAPSNGPPNSDAARSANLWSQLDVPALRTVLNDNRDSLVAQNQLEKGHSQDEAEMEVDTLLELLTLISSAKATLAAESSQLVFKATVDF